MKKETQDHQDTAKVHLGPPDLLVSQGYKEREVILVLRVMQAPQASTLKALVGSQDRREVWVRRVTEVWTESRCLDLQDNTGYLDPLDPQEPQLHPSNVTLRKEHLVLQGLKDYEESWDKKVTLETPVFSVKFSLALDYLAPQAPKDSMVFLGQRAGKEKRVSLGLLDLQGEMVFQAILA